MPGTTNAPMIPIRSPHGSPRQAPFPTALGGRIIPTSITVQAVQFIANFYGVAGALGELISQNYGTGVVGPVPGNTVVPLQFDTKLQAATLGFQLFNTVTDTFTDSSNPSNNGSGVTIFNTDGTITVPSPPFNLYNIANVGLGHVASVFETSNGSQTEQFVMTGPVDMAGPYATALTQLKAAHPPYGGGSTLVGNVSNSYQIDPGIACGGVGSGKTVRLTKGFLTLNSPRSYYFFIARRRVGFTHTQWSADVSTDIFSKVDFVGDGVISGGQTIGAIEDNPTYPLQFPTGFSFTNSLGTNALLTDVYFAVIGQSFVSWINSNPGMNDPA